MLKRGFDILVSALGLLVVSPILLVACVAVWLQDFRSPFYAAIRIGKDCRPFRMIKLRSMVVDADLSGVTSTSGGDSRITLVGRLIRAFKLDELAQLWNVLTGDMSLVGPRPNVVRWGVELYTSEEMKLMTVRPGITDFSSIVFSDEGSILAGAENPDLLYNQLIRPWKSRLSLYYVDNRNFLLDIRLILLTAVAMVSRERALRWIGNELERGNAPPELVRIVARSEALLPFPPPGSDHVVMSKQRPHSTNP